MLCACVRECVCQVMCEGVCVSGVCMCVMYVRECAHVCQVCACVSCM